MQQNFLLAKLLIIILLGFGLPSLAQVGGIEPPQIPRIDSIIPKSYLPTLFVQKTKTIFRNNPYFNFREAAVYPAFTKKSPIIGREVLFYSILILLFLFALLKSFFDKYFTDQLNLFFRRGLKQRQIKNQLLQDHLPSLLFNIYFFISGGFFIAIFLHSISQDLSFPFWQLFTYCSLVLSIIYGVKFVVLKFIGWVFQINKLTDNYTFTIFSINKLLGIFLLPLIIMMALSSGSIATIGWTLSLVLISAMLLYRFSLSIGLLRTESNINAFHFLLYTVSFEILPLLVIYKVYVKYLIA